MVLLHKMQFSILFLFLFSLQFEAHLLALPPALALELALAVSSADWRIVECGKLNAVRICVAIVAHLPLRVRAVTNGR